MKKLLVILAFLACAAIEKPEDHGCINAYRNGDMHIDAYSYYGGRTSSAEHQGAMVLSEAHHEAHQDGLLKL